MLPESRETRMCVLRVTLTPHAPEEEAAGTGPCQTPVDVEGKQAWLR